MQEEVRKHYGCDILTGAELEDQGEEGTALTHWEKRLFEVSDNITLPYLVELRLASYFFHRISPLF